MRRRQFFGGMAGALALGRPAYAGLRRARFGDASVPRCRRRRRGPGRARFQDVGSKVRITDMKVFGVSLTPQSDRPYVFVKLETDAGPGGLGRRHAGRQGRAR